MTLVSLLMSPRGHVVIELVTAILAVVTDNPQLDALTGSAETRIAAALRPRPRCSYLAGFRLYLAFIVYMNIQMILKLCHYVIICQY